MKQDGASPQLYDLSKEVGESNNLAAAHPGRVETMIKSLPAWNERLPQDKPRPPGEAE